MAKAKFLGAVGPFEIYKAGAVVIIQRDGECYCNLRKSDPYFHSPFLKCELILAGEVEAAEEAARCRKARVERLAPYLAIRAERAELAARQFVMEF